MQSAEIIHLPKKGQPLRLKEFEKPKKAREYHGTPYRRERVNCQFLEVQRGFGKRYFPKNEAACDLVAFRTSLGFLNEADYKRAKRFVNMEIVK